MDSSTQALFQAGALALIRHGVGWVGVYFVTHGLLTQTDESQWVGITSGIVMTAASYVWSIYQKKGALGIIADLQSKIPGNSRPPTPPKS